MRRVVAIACVAAVAVLAPSAHANWSSTVDGGSLTVSTATLDDPTGLVAAGNAGTCTRRKPKTLTVDLRWTATTSPRATGYLVLRDGVQVGTVSGAGTTNWSDTTRQLQFSTSYTYTVEATVGGWTSPGATATLTTFNNRCR
jgi:hypothetical protein